MNKILGNFLDKLYEDPRISRIINIFRSVYKNFKPSIIVLVLTCTIFSAKSAYNRRFGYDKIVDKSNKNARYVGNAVLLRGDIFLTTYKNLVNSCVKRKPENKIHYYVVMNGNFYEVYLSRFSAEKNLALLRTDRDGGIYANFLNANYYTLLPKENKISYIGDEVFVSKNLNSIAEYFFDKYKVDGVSNYGFTVKSTDNIRKNHGEAVLNDKLELIGITSGNTTEGLTNRFGNKIEFIDLIKIKNFLSSNGVYFIENKKNIDLFKIKKYTTFMNAKVVCVEENVRLPLVIERRR
jgi:hypothetical protein